MFAKNYCCKNHLDLYKTSYDIMNKHCNSYHDRLVSFRCENHNQDRNSLLYRYDHVLSSFEFYLEPDGLTKYIVGLVSHIEHHHSTLNI